MRLLLLATLILPLVSAGVLIDRIAVIVENKVIKDTDIEREIRITSYLNGERLDINPQARRKAAQRLIDQTIIRREIDAGRYAEADDDSVDKLLGSTLQSRKSPQTYGLTKEQVRSALKWQLNVLHFIDVRFQGGEANAPQATAENAPGSKPAADPFIAWLDDMRKNASIQYREEELR